MPRKLLNHTGFGYITTGFGYITPEAVISFMQKLPFHPSRA
jgi:hypothetical protein